MTQIVLTGVSARCLGDLLKGYGIMALVGQMCPDTRFWWDDAVHLVVYRPCDDHKSADDATNQLKTLVHQTLLDWAKKVSRAFKPVRGSRMKGTQRRGSPLRNPEKHDAFDPDLALWARAIALPFWGKDQTEPHPLFPAHGQEGSGEYLSQIEKAVKAAEKTPQDLEWSLFTKGSPSLGATLESGYLFFPESMKRYATGIEGWEREKGAPRSPWFFLLALRGVMLLRGSLCRLRWGRRSYPAFPFVFEGSTVEVGAAKYFRNEELHLPNQKR